MLFAFLLKVVSFSPKKWSDSIHFGLQKNNKRAIAVEGQEFSCNYVEASSEKLINKTPRKKCKCSSLVTAVISGGRTFLAFLLGTLAKWSHPRGSW